ncbi:MAG: VOC family protein [Oligoflexales bacterium]|nr:VOC family protein [Oligoflexales bacterium]
MSGSQNLAFKILGIDHIGLAPKELGIAQNFLRDFLSLPFHGEEIVESQGTKTVFFGSSSKQDGSISSSDESYSDACITQLELLEATSPTSPIASFLAKKGSGIHHIALRVDKIVAALDHLKKEGVRLIDESPRKGSHETLIAFIHPSATGGLLIELVEKS